MNQPTRAGETDAAAAPISFRVGDAHQPLRSVVEEELRRRITERELAPGSRIVEHTLAETLGVSRNPVREAIRVLEAEGFVVTLPRRGVVVAELDEAAVKDLFMVRATLEGAAAAATARRVAAGEVSADRLDEVLARAERATDDGDLTAVSRLNAEFHSDIIELTGNRLLASMVRPLMWRVRWVFSLSAGQRAPHSWTEHQSLATAITDGDAALAERLASEHVRQAETAALDAVRANTGD